MSDNWDVVGAYSKRVMSMGYVYNQKYHRSDLSADLVRAGYLAGLEAAANVRVQGTIGMVGLSHRVVDAIGALEADPEAIAAIVARVTEGE